MFPASTIDLPTVTGRLEAPRAGTSGVEIQNAVFDLLLRNMAVAIGHGVYSRCFGLQIKAFENMHEVDRNPVNFENVGFRDISYP